MCFPCIKPPTLTEVIIQISRKCWIIAHWLHELDHLRGLHSARFSSYTCAGLPFSKYLNTTACWTPQVHLHDKVLPLLMQSGWFNHNNIWPQSMTQMQVVFFY